MTLKKAFLRGLIGIPIGVFVSTTITVLISVTEGGFGANVYSAVSPALSAQMGGELNAVVFQYILSCILGFAFGMGSAIYSIEKWNLTRQTIVHFVVVSVSMLPVAYVCRWIDPSFLSVIVYFAAFAADYFIIWFIQRQYWKKKVEKMNQKLKNK